MPRGDGTGPRGKGSGIGQGQGKGIGRGKGRGRAGYPIICVCPNCGKEISHRPGIPCNSVKCPQCGTVMARKN